MTGSVETAPVPVPAQPPRMEIVTGVKMTVPLALGYIPLGMAYGLLVAQLGMPWWMAPALSMAAYSGSAELLVIAMAAQYSPISVIAVTMLLVNFRHVFYAFSFPLHVVEGRAARLYSMYALVDEAFALTAARPHGWTKPRLLAMQVTFQATWVVSGLVGVGAGSLIPQPIPGLDFALCAMFITLALDAARTLKELPSVLLAGASYLVALGAFPDQSLLAALLLFVAILCVRHVLTTRSNPNGPSPDVPGDRVSPTPGEDSGTESESSNVSARTGGSRE
ncbi:AzlC family ABC transporter permease [Schaalia sp. ZJ1691]|uniref:AzlC family ABC transporter permease n=1 Tax=Schaalia sp. ZJ1691 TaxID=2709404 RepID=UPI0032179567